MEQPAVMFGQDISGLSHEVDAAEDDKLGVLLVGGVLGQDEGVAAEVGEPDDLLTLVVVSKDDETFAEGLLGRVDAFVKHVGRQPHVLRGQVLPPYVGGKLLRQRLGL